MWRRARAGELRAKQGRPQLLQAGERRERLAPRGPVGVSDQELEECRQVVGLPVAGDVAVAEADLAPGRDPPEEVLAHDCRSDRRAGRRVAEPPPRSVREREQEQAAAKLLERPEDRRSGEPLEPGAWRRRGTPNRGGRPGRRGHTRTEPRPGTNGGLWWNGTRFASSFNACQWMSPVTRAVSSG